MENTNGLKAGIPVKNKEVKYTTNIVKNGGGIAAKAIASSAEESLLNAKPIAAAPELLEALQNFVNLSYPTAKPTKGEREAAFDKAQAAIKKATK